MPTSSDVYPSGSLLVEKTFDEHGNPVVEYKDKSGRLLLKSVYNTPDWMLTYYVYDEMGRLRCVIPPKATQAIWSNWIMTQAVMDELCFRYEYDERGRMVVKKVPGAGPVFMVYDTRNRLVLSQDSLLRAGSPVKWMYTLYDELNRPLATGLWNNSSSLATPFGHNLELG